MRVLCTGSAGFIGSHVTDALLRVGHEVVVVDNLETGFIENVNNDVSEFCPVDIRDGYKLERVFEKWTPEVVIHHAAQMDVRLSVTDPIYDAEVNITGSLNLIRLSKKFGVQKFIYASSGGASYGEPAQLPVSEDAPVNPICPYGITKHTVEHYLFAWKHMYDLNYVVLRYPNVYGRRQNPDGEAGVIAIFAGKMLKDQVVKINGFGNQTRDYVHVSDIARANILALEDDIQGIYNLGSGVGTSVNDIFKLVAEATGYTQRPIYMPEKLGETMHISLDASKFNAATGWSPTYGIEAGIKSVVNSIKSMD